MSEMKLVPVEPDEAMLVNGREALMPLIRLDSYGPLIGIWKDMLSAAPVVSGGGLSGSSSPKSEDTHRATVQAVLALPDALLLEASIITTAELVADDEDDYWKRQTLDSIERVKADPTGEEAQKGIRPVRALLRNLAALIHQAATPDGSQWRPIETAPRDGTVVLVANANNGAVYDAHWQDEGGNGAGWVDGTTDSYEDEIIYTPDFWMPLPAAPEGGERLGALPASPSVPGAEASDSAAHREGAV